MPNRTVVLKTNKGVVRVEMDEGHAPITSRNFIELAQQGFYDGLTFHRHEPGFVIQGGDPEGTGMGGSSRTIPLEVTGQYRHDAAGTIAMARSQSPNSASSQFYFTLGPCTFLDGNYATFGKVTEGLDVVQTLRKGDRMESVKVEEALEG